MNYIKIGSLLAYISSRIKDINLRKLIKLVYLIDEKSVCDRGIPITWLDYYVWKKGPVAPCIYELKNNGGKFSNFVSVLRNRENKVIIIPSINELDSSLLFSRKELKLINEIIDEYGNLSADNLSLITHEINGLWYCAKKRHNINFEHSSQTNIKLDLRELIKKDQEKINVYNDAHDIAML